MKKKNLVPHLLLAFLSFALTLGAHFSSLLESFELKSLDLRFLLRGKMWPDPALLIVGIDDASLARFGRWPWPRSLHSELLKALAEHPPRAVGFDLLFREKDEENPQFDEALIYSTRLLDHVVYASYFELEGEGAEGEKLRKMEEQRQLEEALLETTALAQVEGDPAQLLQAQEVNLPFADLARSAEFGFINAPRDSDGVIRRLPLVLAYKGKVYPSFDLELLLDYWGVKREAARVVVGKGIEVERRDRKTWIPTDPEGRLLINFAGEHFDFQELLFVQVVNALNQIEKGEKPDIDLEIFRKKIVLVALTATGTTDMGAFPFSDHSPLVAIHANALNTILQGNYLREVGPAARWGILAAMALAVFLSSSLLAPLRSAAAAALLLLGFSAGNFALFQLGWWIPLIAPLLLWVLTYLSITTYRYFTEEKEKKYVRKAFGQYVSPKILKELLEDPSKLKLGGERRELTVLFSDIRGFTTFCENRQPEEVVEVLNEYLDKMTEVILKHDGTLDKYVGDAIVAFFGAPSPKIETDHALKACQAALEMVEALQTLQQKWRAEGKEPLSSGIGINTGPVLVGNIGSHRKYDYTVIGDNVNLGSRLEGLTRKYNCNIILSESTFQQLSDRIEVRQIDQVTVKGKNKPVVIYELLGLK